MGRTFNVTKPFIFSLLIVVPFLAFLSQGFAAEKTIGVIMNGDIPYYRDVHSAFLSRLDRGIEKGRVEIAMQKPYPDPISLSNAARKLIALDVDVIVVYGLPAAQAAVAEKTDIPIVYMGVYEPLVPKIKAKNITGMALRVSVSSLLRYLRGMTSLTTLGVVYSSNEEDSVYQMKELLGLSKQYGFKVEGINLKRAQDARAMLAGKKLDAVFITGSSIASMASSAIMEHSQESRIPTASMIPDKAAHAIITLSSNPKEQGEKTADMVIKILGGTPAGKIKTDSSSDVELIFNLREAKIMGFKIPMDLVTEATKLIQ